MTARDAFIDAMGNIDEDLLETHLRRKCPTRGYKTRKYVMAAAMYVAACLVLVAVLPLIIGNEKTPPPPDSGDTPIIVETSENPDINSGDTTTDTNVPEPKELPTATTVFSGCEFTISLDKHSYTLSDTIHATVTLENKSDNAVGLWHGHLGNYLDNVGFYENGEWRWSYSSDWDMGYSDAIQCGPLTPGGIITYEVEFTPGAPNDTSDPVASMDSLWEIVADVKYYLNPEDEVDYENVKTATVTVAVPHSGDDVVVSDSGAETDNISPETSDIPPKTDDIVPDTDDNSVKYPFVEGNQPQPLPKPQPTTIKVGISGKTAVLRQGSAEYSRIMNSFNNLEYYIHSQAELLYRIREGGYKNILNKGIYAELVYDGSSDMRLNGVTIPNVRRVLISLGDCTTFPLVVVSGSDDYAEPIVGHLVYSSPEMISAVTDIVNGNNTPRKTVEKDGLRFSVVLDKTSYTVNDKVRTTLILENTGSDPVTLRDLSSNHFLSHVYLYISGELVYRNGIYNENSGLGIPVFYTLYPGDAVAYTDLFDVSDAYPYAKWEIFANLSYYFGMVDTDDFDNLKKAELKLEIPHESGEEIVRYPDPYISKQTTTSVAKTLFGCEYTMTIDKAKYEKGDTVTAVVKFENNGRTSVYLGGKHINHVLDYVSFTVNGVGSYDVGGAPGDEKYLVAPGNSISYTVEFDAGEAGPSDVCAVVSRIELYVYGEKHTENVEIKVPCNDGL